MPTPKLKQAVSIGETSRREPTQARAQRTIDTIFQATAQIVEAEGVAGLNTNKIARKAGFSVGTLYQYFPTKEAILLALIERERARQMQRMAALLEHADAVQQQPKETVRAFIALFVAGFGSGWGPKAKARQAMIRLGWQLDHNDSVTTALRQVSEQVAFHFQKVASAPNGPPLRTTPAALFVITRAVLGVVRSALMERSPLLGSDAFIDELTHMVWRSLEV